MSGALKILLFLSEHFICTQQSTVKVDRKYITGVGDSDRSTRRRRLQYTQRWAEGNNEGEKDLHHTASLPNFQNRVNACQLEPGPGCVDYTDGGMHGNGADQLGKKNEQVKNNLGRGPDSQATTSGLDELERSNLMGNQNQYSFPMQYLLKDVFRRNPGSAIADRPFAGGKLAETILMTSVHSQRPNNLRQLQELYSDEGNSSLMFIPTPLVHDPKGKVHQGDPNSLGKETEFKHNSSVLAESIQGGYEISLGNDDLGYLGTNKGKSSEQMLATPPSSIGDSSPLETIPDETFPDNITADKCTHIQTSNLTNAQETAGGATAWDVIRTNNGGSNTSGRFPSESGESIIAATPVRRQAKYILLRDQTLKKINSNRSISFGKSNKKERLTSAKSFPHGLPVFMGKQESTVSNPILSSFRSDIAQKLKLAQIDVYQNFITPSFAGEQIMDKIINQWILLHSNGDPISRTPNGTHVSNPFFFTDLSNSHRESSQMKYTRASLLNSKEKLRLLRTELGDTRFYKQLERLFENEFSFLACWFDNFVSFSYRYYFNRKFYMEAQAKLHCGDVQGGIEESKRRILMSIFVYYFSHDISTYGYQDKYRFANILYDLLDTTISFLSKLDREAISWIDTTVGKNKFTEASFHLHALMLFIMDLIDAVGEWEEKKMTPVAVEQHSEYPLVENGIYLMLKLRYETEEFLVECRYRNNNAEMALSEVSQLKDALCDMKENPSFEKIMNVAQNYLKQIDEFVTANAFGLPSPPIAPDELVTEAKMIVSHEFSGNRLMEELVELIGSMDKLIISTFGQLKAKLKTNPDIDFFKNTIAVRCLKRFILQYETKCTTPSGAKNPMAYMTLVQHIKFLRDYGENNYQTVLESNISKEITYSDLLSSMTTVDEMPLNYNKLIKLTEVYENLKKVLHTLICSLNDRCKRFSESENIHCIPIKTVDQMYSSPTSDCTSYTKIKVIMDLLRYRED